MGLGLENPLHIAIFLLIVLLLFGAKRLPEAGRGLGRGLREFRDSLTARDSDLALQAPSDEAHASPRSSDA